MRRSVVTMSLCGAALMLALGSGGAHAAPPTSFTYQGQLKNGALPVNGTIDVQATLFDVDVNGAALAGPISVNTVAVANGLFTAVLDFGAGKFDGTPRWLEIAVRMPGEVNFQTLTPRQPITAAPFALFAANGPGAGGGNTLDQAYDQGGAGAGRNINADAGPVFITGPDGLVSSAGVSTGTVELERAGRSLDVEVHRGPLVDLNGPQNASIGGIYRTGTLGSPVDHFAYLRVTGSDHRIIRDPASDLRFSTQTVIGNAGVTVLPVDQMTLTDDGKLGVGTSVPDFDITASRNTNLIGPSSPTTIGAHQRNVLINPSIDRWIYMGAGSPHSITRHDGSDLAFVMDDSGRGSPVEQMRLTNDGNLGIGTSSPGYLLDVDGRMRVREGGGTAGIWLYQTTPATDRAFVGMQSDTTVGLYGATGAGWDLVMNTTTGNVGVGTTSPDAKLQVEGGTDSALAGGGFVVVGSTAGTNISIDNNEIMARNNGAPATLFLNNDGGTVRVPVLEITGADLAEKFPVSEEAKPGTVMAIDPSAPGKLCIAKGAYNKRVAGIVSGANDLPVGAVLGHLPGADDAPPIALSGRVWVQCDASNGPIGPGDLLTTSSTAGQGMKVTDFAKAQGAIIGKAMTALPDGNGFVLVLVSLQ